MLESLKKSLTAVVFPAHCLECEVPLNTDATREWCDRCFHELVGDEQEVCFRCAAHLGQPSPFESGCAFCYKSPFKFDAAISIGNYRGTLQSAVLEMKRAHGEATAYQFGTLLGKLALEQGPDSFADLIIPMPIYWWSRLKRGFCAAAIIAAGLSAQTGIPVNENILRQNKRTKKQGMLSNTARFKNVKDAFSIRSPSKVKDKAVLLVDDVMTSGATANEATKVLKKAGAHRVCIAVVARGVRAS